MRRRGRRGRLSGKQPTSAAWRLAAGPEGAWARAGAPGGGSPDVVFLCFSSSAMARGAAGRTTSTRQRSNESLCSGCRRQHFCIRLRCVRHHHYTERGRGRCELCNHVIRATFQKGRQSTGKQIYKRQQRWVLECGVNKKYLPATNVSKGLYGSNTFSE